VTIVRREHRSHFTIVPNAIFADERLSIEAKGVLGYLLSRPHKWRVRLEHVGRTLRIGRKKLQRIFRELIGTGYVTREQQRIVDGHRFGAVDYVVRDVPISVNRPAEIHSIPQGQKGPAVPRVQKGPAYKDSPRGQKRPAYKETDKNGDLQRFNGISRVEGRRGSAMKRGLKTRVQDEDARLDAQIVELIGVVAEGWELLCGLPDDVLAQLRERRRRGELDEIAIMELRIQYRETIQGRRRAPRAEER